MSEMQRFRRNGIIIGILLVALLFIGVMGISVLSPAYLGYWLIVYGAITTIVWYSYIFRYRRRKAELIRKQ